MATAVGSLESIDLVIDYLDATGETGRVVIPLGTTTSDANVVSIIDNITPLTNAFMDAKVVKKYAVTGNTQVGKPAAGPERLIASIFAADFERANPLNAAKFVSKQVIIPAYDTVFQETTPKPVHADETNTNLAALITLLQNHLDYVDVAGTHYEGGFTYNPASKFGTKLTVTDGF